MKTSLLPLGLAGLALLYGFGAAACQSPERSPGPERPTYTAPRPAPGLKVAGASNEKPDASATESVNGATAAKPQAADTQAASVLYAANADTVLATVGGKPIRISDLMQHWMFRQSRQVWEYFSEIMDGRYAELEAARMGITLDPALVDAAVIDVRVVIEKNIEEAQPGLGFDRYIRGQFKMSPENYLAGIRRDQTRGLLLERVVRTWLLTQEHATVRVISVNSEELGDQVKAALDAGQEFADVAREFSQDPSGEEGGLMAPIVRSEQLLLSIIAFKNEVGGVTGPIENNGQLMWVMTSGFPKPLRGRWSSLGPKIEASLKERGLNQSEFLMWRTEVEANYDLDPTAFLELIGEAPERP